VFVLIGSLTFWITTQIVYIIFSEVPQCDIANTINRSYLDGK